MSSVSGKSRSGRCDRADRFSGRTRRGCGSGVCSRQTWTPSPARITAVIRAGDEGLRDREILTQLLDDAMREDAAAEFSMRGFPDYDLFAAAVRSCADNIVTDGTIPPSGNAGIPTMQPTSGPQKACANTPIPRRAH